MNREIKFRGKVFLKEEWVYGDLVKTKNVVAIKKTNGDYFHPTQVSPNTVGQYTGLKDKNGKEIYEGDILRLTMPDGSIRHFVVEWASEDRILRPLSNFVSDGNPVRISGWCFNWNGYCLYPTVIDGIPDNEVMTIVGNIFDNPEMMKGGSNEA